jgi:hypothetical protein
METDLDNLAKAFRAWRASPNKGRNTPDHLLSAIAQIIDHTSETTLIKQLGVSRAVLDRARALKIPSDKSAPLTPVCALQPESADFVPLDVDVPTDAISPLGFSPVRGVNEDIPSSVVSMQLPISDQRITIEGSVQQIANVLILMMRGARV